MRIAKAASILSIGVLAGCGGGGGVREGAISTPKRDLTLTTSVPRAPQVASKVELVSARPARRRRVTRPVAHVEIVPASKRPVVQPTARPEEVVIHPLPASEPAAKAIEPDPTGRELPPGKTVTVVPPSAGPSTGDVGAGGWSDLPEAPKGRGVIIGRGQGGGCWSGRGRGPVSILR